MKKIDEVNVNYLNKDIVLEIFQGDSEGVYEEKTYPYTDFIEKLKGSGFFNKISHEIAEDCFSQSDSKPSQDEVVEFKHDIILTKLILFKEDLMIHMIAEKFLPNMRIIVQVDYDCDIIDFQLIDSSFIS